MTPRVMSSVSWCPRFDKEATHIYLVCCLDGVQSPDALEVSWDEIGVIGAAPAAPAPPDPTTLPVWLSNSERGADTRDCVFLASDDPALLKALGLDATQQKWISKLLQDGYYIRLRWTGTGWETNHNKVYILSNKG